jgi:uncharacterized protein YjbI with pentapeptide repeats
VKTCRFDPCSRPSDDSTNDGYCILHSANPTKDKSDFYKALVGTPTDDRDYFSYFVFPEGDYFCGRTLNSPTFAQAKFIGKVSFRNATFKGHSDFQGAEFADTADFVGACFNGKADFESARVVKDAHFFQAKFEKGVRFQQITFGGRANFSEAKFGKDDDSEGSDQVSSCSASASSERANFRDATFEGEAHFTGATFWCKADFPHAKFNDRSYFYRSQFKKKAKEATFLGAQFAQHVNFVEANFGNGVEFTGATFERGANFRGTIFSGTAYFLSVRFLGPTVFAPNTLSFPFHEKGKEPLLPFSTAEEVFFVEVTLEPLDAITFKDADFQRCWFQGTDLRQAEITNAKWPKIHRLLPSIRERFPRVNRLFPKLGACNGLYDEVDSLKKLKERKAQTRESQKDETLPWSHLEQSYRQLKQNCEDRRDYEQARDFHYGEKEMRRKNPENPLGLRILLWVYRLVSGYGERALRPFLWAVGLLGACAALYLCLGVRPKVASSTLSWASASDWLKAFEYSFRVMTLLRPDDLGLVSQGCAKLVFLFESIAGPVLLGLFGLALRQRLKR